MEGDFTPEEAAGLADAALKRQSLDEYAEKFEPACLDGSDAAAEIQKGSLRIEQSGGSFAMMLLAGHVYQWWRNSGEGDGCPMVAEIAELMRISRSTFYRQGLSSRKIRLAYHDICESIRDGLEKEVASRDPENDD